MKKFPVNFPVNGNFDRRQVRGGLHPPPISRTCGAFSRFKARKARRVAGFSIFVGRRRRKRRAFPASNKGRVFVFASDDQRASALGPRSVATKMDHFSIAKRRSQAMLSNTARHLAKCRAQQQSACADRRESQLSTAARQDPSLPTQAELESARTRGWTPGCSVLHRTRSSSFFGLHPEPRQGSSTLRQSPLALKLA